MNDQIVTLEEQAVQAVREAGALLADPAAVRSIRAKSKTDYVTNVDVAVQEFLRERLAALAPDIQFMGEEQDNRPLDWSRPCWILDPVDGTTNLIHRFRHSAVSLALAEGGQIRLGVVYNPYSGECFTARRGLGAFCNGSPIRVSGTDRLGDSLLSVGTVPGCRELADTAFRQMRDLYDACQDIRRTGCASLDLCWVACGRLEGYVELSLQPWDYAAGLLLVEEAGGRVTAPDGASGLRAEPRFGWCDLADHTLFLQPRPCRVTHDTLVARLYPWTQGSQIARLREGVQYTPPGSDLTLAWFVLEPDAWNGFKRNFIEFHERNLPGGDALRRGGEDPDETWAFLPQDLRPCERGEIRLVRGGAFRKRGKVLRRARHRRLQLGQHAAAQTVARVALVRIALILAKGQRVLRNIRVDDGARHL